MSDFDIAYYKDGVPYNSAGSVVLTITSGKTMNSTGGGGTDLTYGLGLDLALNSSNLGQTVSPLAYAHNVEAIHRQEMGIALDDTDAKQKTLDAALVTAQQNSISAGTTYLSQINATPAVRAQNLVAYQTALVAEAQAKIATEQNAATYINEDILLNDARIWWPETTADAAAAQTYIDGRQKDLDAVNALIAEDQKNLATLQSQQTTVASETDAIESAVQFTADFLGEVSAKLGKAARQTAQDLVDVSVGKTLRSAEEALEAFNRYRGEILSKFSAQDLQAIANALASVDSARLADDLAKYTKALSLVSHGIDAFDVGKVLADSVKSGDYKPFFVKLETLGAGYLASELTAWTFAVLTGTAPGLLAYALLLAVVGAMIDEDFISKVNDKFFK